MKVVLALRFVEKTVPVDAETERTVRVLQQQTGNVEVNPITGSLVCHDFGDWQDVPLEVL